MEVKGCIFVMSFNFRDLRPLSEMPSGKICRGQKGVMMNEKREERAVKNKWD